MSSRACATLLVAAFVVGGMGEGMAQQAKPQERVDRIQNPSAVFAGLDKITGRIVRFDVAVDETVQFGALQVTPKSCLTTPPTEQPETVGFVEVDEITLQKETRRIFSGWMFAASPGLNAVEHPIYDVWLIDCKGGARPEAPALPKAGEQAPGSTEGADSPEAPMEPGEMPAD